MYKIKSKHTSMSIVHIKLKCFCGEENIYLGLEKRQYIEIAGQIYGKLKFVNLCIENNIRIMFM